MKPLLLTLLLVPVGLAAPPESASRERIPVGEDLELSLEVPGKWTLSRSAGGGYPSLSLQNADRSVVMHLALFPDASGLMADKEMQLVMLGDVIAPYLPDSVEKGARTRPLNPRHGSGLYCVFTDAKLAGVKELPPNEYRHATAGLKIATGWFAVFTMLSQDVDSADYQTCLDLLRNSLHGEAAAPAKVKRNPLAF